MSIATDITVDIVIDNVKVDEYELSDTLDNYTIEEVQEAAYCGQYNIARRNNCLRTYDYGWAGAFDKDTGVFQYPFKVERIGNTYSWQTGATGYNAPDGLYGGTVWLSSENSTFDSVITNQNANNYRLVTKWNVNKFIFTLPALSGAYGQVSSVTWDQKPYPACYIPEGWGTMTYHTAKGMPYDQTADVLLRPYNIFVFEEKFFLIANKVEAGFIYNSTQEVGSPKVFGDSSHYSYDRSTTIATSYNADYESPISKSGGGYNQDFGLSTYPEGNRIPFQWQGPGGYQIWYQAAGEDVQNYICFWDHSGYASNGGYIRMSFYFCKVDDVLHYFANMGVYFYADKLYKPIIEDTIVTGYTDDMETVSDIDNWDGDTIHNVPIIPPVPPSPTGDDIDKQHFGGGTALGGAENLWLLTTAQMTSLHNAISSCDVPNFEPLNSVISVMGLAIPPTYPLGTDIATLITINIRKADGTLWSTHTEGHICDKQTASFGFTNNIKIKRRYNNFLDYPPYSSHEIFLPLCGWLPLPAYAVGRNLTVYYVHDINTCSVRGLVFCEGSLIGEKYGTMGANIPFSSSGHSLYVGGLITGGVQTLADFATALSTKGPMALMSAINGVAEGANTLVASNQNRTSVIGQNQDRTSFADGQYIRIKSTYPDVKIEENFGHTFGFVCNKKGQLKDFKGFTTCENPHVYGFSCTSEEKDEIERLLKAGIIINIPEE
jgi:hypothetical protein